MSRSTDMVLARDSLEVVLALRGPDVFAVASQIHPRNPESRREETNWTAYDIVHGLVEISERLPEDDGVRESFYAGGGSSLFRKRLLERVMSRVDPYAPFYWEDVEWSTLARRHGFRVLFCPASRAWHEHRATVSKFYPAQEVAHVFRRNGYRYQLRNVIEDADPSEVFRATARQGWRPALDLLTPACVTGIVAARIRSWFLAGRRG